MFPMSAEMLDNWFTYHAPQPGQPEQYERIRAAARQFAQVIVEETPAGPDQSAAVRKVREAVYTANAGIACDRTRDGVPAGAGTGQASPA